MCDAGSSPTRTVARPTPPSCATSRATSARTFCASALPSMVVAAIGLSVRENDDVTPLPRKNDPASIAARRDALGLDGTVDLAAYAKAAESVTGVAVIPVSVAQLPISLGSYSLDDDGDVVETGRADEEVTVPLAHSEGGLTASVQRGAKAVELSGGFRTYVVADRITRASCFVCKDARDALTLAQWIDERIDEMRDWLRSTDI